MIQSAMRIVVVIVKRISEDDSDAIDDEFNMRTR